MLSSAGAESSAERLNCEILIDPHPVLTVRNNAANRKKNGIAAFV